MSFPISLKVYIQYKIDPSITLDQNYIKVLLLSVFLSILFTSTLYCKVKNNWSSCFLRTKTTTTDTMCDKLIFRDAKLTFTLSNLEMSKKRIMELLISENGRIFFEEENKHDDIIENKILVGVTDDHFDPLVSKLVQNIDGYENKKIQLRPTKNSNSILNNELEKLTNLEIKYLDQLSRSLKLSESHILQRRLTQIHKAITYLEFQKERNQLPQQLSYVNIELKSPYPKQDISYPTIVSNFIMGWNFLLNGIMFLIKLWPVYFLYFSIRIWHKYKKKNSKTPVNN